MCGIAQPGRFVNSVRACGAAVADTMHFRDHHWYTKAEVANVIARARELGAAVVTTLKDAVKLQELWHMFADAGIAAYVLPIEAQLTNGTNAIAQQLETLTAHSTEHNSQEEA
jgi:tetraacyldisaccharide 4'-kinase